MRPPKEFYRSTWDWFSNTELYNSDASYREIDISNQFREKFKKPKSINGFFHRKFTQELRKQPKPNFVAEIPNGRAWGKDGFIITPDNRILWDVSVAYHIRGEIHPIFRTKRVQSPRYVDEVVAVVAFRFSHIYYHWLFDVLPRLHLLRSIQKKYSKLLVSFNADKPLSFQTETLALLNIPEDKTIECRKGLHLEARQLVVPSIAGYSCSMPKWTCDFLRKEFLNTKLKPKEKLTETGNTELIYISREKARFRKVINEDKVMDILAQYGFKKVILEGMPFTEQVKLFSGAKMIVSAHGSGLANLVFCNPKTKILELFPPNYIHPVYWILSNHVKLDYYYLVGEGKRLARFRDQSPVVWEDISVNLLQLKELLEKMRV